MVLVPGQKIGEFKDYSKPATNGSKPLSKAELQSLADKAELERLRAENARLKGQRSVRLKVSEKGALSIYGVTGRFPATHYANQWEAFLDMADDIRAFIKANHDQLSWGKKDD